MRVAWLVLGGIAILIGLIWTLQGLDILGGSGMSGRPIFAIIGLLVVVVGAALVTIGIRRRPTPTA